MRRCKFTAIVCLSFFLCCCSCSLIPPQAKEPAVTAVIGAFDKEVIIFHEQLAGKKEQTIEGIRFVTGRLGSRKVVVTFTGMGKVNAAMTTTLLLEHFRPGEVIFTGIAGRLNPQLQPGDIVIAEKTAQHDLGIFTSDGLKNRGEINPLTSVRNPLFFPADSRLLKLAESSAKEVRLDIIKTSEGERKPRIIKGTVVTGDIFVASLAKTIELRERLQADAVEMEGAAVAQICYQRAVPCIIIRSISDRADEKAMEELSEFLDIAAKNSAKLVVEIIGRLSSKPAD